MEMQQNKETIKQVLLKSTAYNQEQCDQIIEVLNRHKLIGKRNKEKMVDDFMKQLNLSFEKADQLYNTCSEIRLHEIFK